MARKKKLPSVKPPPIRPRFEDVERWFQNPNNTRTEFVIRAFVSHNRNVVTVVLVEHSTQYRSRLGSLVKLTNCADAKTARFAIEEIIDELNQQGYKEVTK